jgi:SAM-dependent methyltransferase
MLGKAHELDNLPLAQGDVFRLPFADGAFDIVTLITTLEFLERPEAALAETARVARQGVLLGVLNRWSLLALRRRLRGLLRPTVYDDARFYDVGSLKRLLGTVADDPSGVRWCTTLFPCWMWRVLPGSGLRAQLPWGGFIAMALHQA